MKTTKRISKRSRAKETLPVPTKSYSAKLDSKKRIVLRSAKHEHYKVRENADGSLVLTPMELIDLPISSATMKTIETSMRNMQRGIVSKPIDLDAILKMLKDK